MGRPCCRSLVSARCPMNAGHMRLAVSAVEQYGGWSGSRWSGLQHTWCMTGH